MCCMALCLTSIFWPVKGSLLRPRPTVHSDHWRNCSRGERYTKAQSKGATSHHAQMLKDLIYSQNVVFAMNNV